MKGEIKTANWVLFVLLLAAACPAQTLVGKNFSGGKTVPVNPNPGMIGGVLVHYAECNFSTRSLQLVDGEWVAWPIDLAKPATFYRCNFTNAKPPEGSTLINCNTTLRRNAVQGTTETLRIGLKELPVPTYENIILGKTDPKTLKPVYKSKPTKIVCEPPDTKDGRRAARIRAKYEEYQAKLAEANAAKAEFNAEPVVGVIGP